jgi:hypothetical protein
MLRLKVLISTDHMEYKLANMIKVRGEKTTKEVEICFKLYYVTQTVLV